MLTVASEQNNIIQCYFDTDSSGFNSDYYKFIIGQITGLYQIKKTSKKMFT